MADLQKTSEGKGITYPGTNGTGDPVVDSQTPGTKLYIFLNGGEVAGKKYPKVDMSLWDQATMCGTCHVGGTTYEHDRNGKRLPLRTFEDMMSGDVNPFTTTVWENFTPEGIESSFATIAPWVYPQYKGNNPANGPVMADPSLSWVSGEKFGGAPAGTKLMDMKNPNTGGNMPVYAGQLMMPNVKEMDCLFCHLSGYDNVMASVMTQAGSLNAAPGAGAGMFDISPASPTYMGYTEQMGTVTFAPYSTAQTGRMQLVSMSEGALGRLKAQPDSNNCMQCHATKTLKDLPEMFGITGGSNGFLSSAPMVYDPVNGVGPNGKRMTTYDINAMWLPTGSFSPTIDNTNFQNHFMAPGMAYLQAMDTVKRGPEGFMGGNKGGGTGPLYYDNADGTPATDQNILKRSTMPFPRAEWFKRGDAWQPGQDVHSSFGCAGCHFTGDSTHKNQCDPGRGFDMSSTTMDGVPPLSQRQVVKGWNADGTAITTTVPEEQAAAIQAHDTRNTVKRCEFCHITGKDYFGNPITTFGAPNPTAAHTKYGLTSNMVQIVNQVDTHGSFGGQGISKMTNFTSAKTKLGKGNHLDVMDCTVCHVQKVSMAVRALDATSGMRFPAIVGTDPAKGMVGLFEDPAPDTFNQGVVDQYNQMFAGYNTTHNLNPGDQGYMQAIPNGTQMMGGALREWKPLKLWQKMGNMETPLTFGNGKASGLQFRRKIYLSNAISAVIWNNYSSTIDANGDTVPGGLLIGDDDKLGRTVKPSLAGYTDVFDNDPPDENNTQGYGEPIYDPWVQRDLKAGMNFAGSALSVISIGFGPMDGQHPSASAYTPDGLFAPGDYWKYASVWSGAVVFTEPYQIADYKAYRNSLEADKPAALRKSWDKTELAYVGAPFMVTHGVKTTESYVKGKSCADCHAPGAEFFNGGFTMTGTAVPATEMHNATTQATVNDAIGEVERTTGIADFNAPTNLMQRPLEPYRVKANIGDLRTVFEGFNKLGQPRSVKFENHDATHVWTTDLKRSNVLYPEEDGAIYYKIADTNEDGSIKPGATPMTGQEYADYMETIAANAAAMGIGVAPTAAIELDGKAGTGFTSINLVKGQSYPLNAANPTSFTKYTWDTNAGVEVAAGASTTVMFPKAGTWRITLTATNPDGQVITKLQRVNVVEPSYIVPGAVSSALEAGKLMTTVPVTISTLAAGTDYDEIKFSWGDGSKAVSLKTFPIADQKHQYLRYAKYLSADGTKYNYRTTVQLLKLQADGITKSVVASKVIAVSVNK